MRLDPVYLVAPQPERKPPTRRAFLAAGATFFTGLALGGACGFAVRGGTVQAAEPETLPPAPTGDADLDQLRRLAVEAPIDELMANAQLYLDVMHDTYPDDVVLWRGAERIAREVLDNPLAHDRRTTGRWLIQVIRGSRAAAARQLAPLIPDLRRATR